MFTRAARSPGNFICHNMAAPRIRLTGGIADDAVWRTLARDSDELQICSNGQCGCCIPDTRKAAARRQLLDIRSDSGATRTRDPQLRRLLLYPTELRNRNLSSKRDCKDKQNSLQAASFGRRSCLEIYVDKIQNSFQNFFGGVVNVQVQHEIKLQQKYKELILQHLFRVIKRLIYPLPFPSHSVPTSIAQAGTSNW